MCKEVAGFRVECGECRCKRSSVKHKFTKKGKITKPLSGGIRWQIFHCTGKGCQEVHTIPITGKYS